jgi:hypothetical protein
MLKKTVFVLCALFSLPALAQVGGVYSPASGGGGMFGGGAEYVGGRP